jgi:transcriptional regulator with XRE-family HTH domain
MSKLLRKLESRREDREFGARLREMRERLRITEQEAAGGAGVTLKTYQRWERGKPSNGSAEPVIRLSKRFGVSLNWLLMGEYCSWNGLVKFSDGIHDHFPRLVDAPRRRRAAQSIPDLPPAS